jgi:hypothetical protein
MDNLQFLLWGFTLDQNHPLADIVKGGGISADAEGDSCGNYFYSLSGNFLGNPDFQ